MPITSAMPSVTTLPEELLIEIFLKTPHNSLPTTALVSRKFNRCVTPMIYRYVHFMEVGGGPHNVLFYPRSPDWQSTPHKILDTYGEIPHRDSRIICLACFLRTIRASTILRAHVVAASFGWYFARYKTADFENTISCVLGLLAPSLRFLHLSPPEHDKLYIPYDGPITSLDNQYICDLAYRGYFGDDLEDTVYSNFSMPTLQQLTLSDRELWLFSRSLAAKDRSRTSKITSLSVELALPPGDRLARVLTWPFELRSFYYSDALLITSAKPLIYNLQPQRASLEELLIAGEYCTQSVIEVGSLRNFASLRRLGLPRNYIINTEKEFTTLAQNDPERLKRGKEPLVKPYEVLPPSLEELQIQVSPHFEWSQYMEDNSTKEMTKGSGELSAWLCEIAQHKLSRYPSLRKVVVWQSGGGIRAQAFYVVKAEKRQLEALPESSELLSVFKDADVDISWVVSGLPPLFCV